MLKNRFKEIRLRDHQQEASKDPTLERPNHSVIEK
jgi:hypothetical protein